MYIVYRDIFQIRRKCLLYIILSLNFTKYISWYVYLVKSLDNLYRLLPYMKTPKITKKCVLSTKIDKCVWDNWILAIRPIKKMLKSRFFYRRKVLVATP